MSPGSLGELLARLKGRLAALPESERELAERVATNLATLTARKLAGEQDLDADLAHAKAAAASLSVAAGAAVLEEFGAWVTALVKGLLDKVLPLP